jgi:hypothetical protein
MIVLCPFTDGMRSGMFLWFVTEPSVILGLHMCRHPRFSVFRHSIQFGAVDLAKPLELMVAQLIVPEWMAVCLVHPSALNRMWLAHRCSIPGVLRYRRPTRLVRLLPWSVDRTNRA